MIERYFVGIDPGKTGAISIINKDKSLVECYRIPDSERELVEIFRDLEGKVYLCLLEKVSSMPGQGVKSMFTFGKGYGFLRACLMAFNIPFDDVLPNTWQKALSCQTKGDKNVSKNKASQLFPKIKMTHWKADSLLISEYNWRTYHGKY